MTIADNWKAAAAGGDPPAALIDTWIWSVKGGDKAAFDALTTWLMTLGAARGWRWPVDDKGEG
jgi:hypothetical protein